MNAETHDLSSDQPINLSQNDDLKTIESQYKSSLFKHSEYQSKLDSFIKKANEPEFIKLQIKNILQDDLSKIYQLKAGASGLQNLGNTCYMNSVLQCLRHTMIFNNYLFGQKV